MRSVVHENSDGDKNISSLPWLLTKQQSNAIKEVILKIKFPTTFSSNINRILTKKGEFGRVKTHYWHTSIKVIILVYIFIYWYTSTFFCFLSTLGMINNSFFFLQYVLPLSLLGNFDNNVKLVIYDLGNYMR